jgi:GntR family transcriptional regulator
MAIAPMLEIWGGMAADLEIESQIQHLIEDGSLHAGEELPSVRSVSVELMISPRAVERAYGELQRRGFVVSDDGRFTVAALASGDTVFFVRANSQRRMTT